MGDVETAKFIYAFTGKSMEEYATEIIQKWKDEKESIKTIESGKKPDKTA